MRHLRDVGENRPAPKRPLPDYSRSDLARNGYLTAAILLVVGLFLHLTAVFVLGVILLFLSMMSDPRRGGKSKQHREQEKQNAAGNHATGNDSRYPPGN